MPWHKARLSKGAIYQFLSFIFTDTDCRIFETYSQHDTPLRSFTGVDEVEAAFDLGTDLHGNGVAQKFALWSPTVMPEPTIRRIELAMRGHSHRYVAEGCGLFHLHLGGSCHDLTTESLIGSWTERGARQRCAVSPGPDDTDWAAHSALRSRLCYRLSTLSAAA